MVVKLVVVLESILLGILVRLARKQNNYYDYYTYNYDYDLLHLQQLLLRPLHLQEQQLIQLLHLQQLRPRLRLHQLLHITTPTMTKTTTTPAPTTTTSAGPPPPPHPTRKTSYY